MTIDEELALSYYKEISDLNKEHKVYLVKNIQTSRLYVKKVLSVYNLDVYRYLIRHPVKNTPRIYEAVEDNGKLIVIEEYINGTSLRDYLAKGTVSEAEAVSITIKLCEIVQDLHHCIPPIVHRDIKPSNIILMDDGSVRLLDMNAAKQYLGEAEQDTQLIGTAGFAAPEQYGFGSSTIQTDMYAIGVLMAVLVHGSFSRHALTDSPYDRIIEKCTRIDPGDRFISVRDILNALRLVRSSETGVKAKERFVRWLPPGFRTLKPGRIIVSLILYAFLVAVGMGLTVENPVSRLEITLNKLFFILCCLAAVFIIGNYMDVWDKIGIRKIKNKWLQWLAAIAAGVAAFFLVFILFMIVETIIR